MRRHLHTSLVLSTLIVVALFILAEALAHTYQEEITRLTETYNYSGKLFFVLMAAFAVIIPLWSNVFLLPVGAIAWGPFEAALLCILGWWIGSVASFFLARVYKERLLNRYPSLTANEFVDSLISSKHKLLSLIFLRMTLPVEILSYALGLFSTKVSWKENALTTLIGIAPFAFIFSYTGTFSPQIQGMVLTLSTILFIIYYLIQRRGV